MDVHQRILPRNMPASVTSNDEKSAASASIEAEIPTMEGQIDQGRLFLKLDWRLLPIVTLLYLWSFLDRTNIGKSICSFYGTSIERDILRECEDCGSHRGSSPGRLAVQYLRCRLLRVVLRLRSSEQHGSEKIPSQSLALVIFMCVSLRLTNLAKSHLLW
jgi:hypothetical protein